MSRLTPDNYTTARVVSIAEFIATDEAGAEALIGASGDEALLAEDSDAMFYGSGGSGKTTLTIDLACHLAAGDPWLGIPINRPVNVLLVENEGPRPLYRQKLRRKIEAWQGSPLGNRLHVFEEPWASIRVNETLARGALIDAIYQKRIDVVIIGPVSRSGMDDAGTLAQVRDFMQFFDVGIREELRKIEDQCVAFVLIHHDNKGGTVSGAWEGAGDTLFHVQGQGHGRTRLYIQKARWSPRHHQTTLNLLWAPGDAYEVEDKPEFTDETLAEQIVAAIESTPGTAWTRVEEQTPGVNKARRRGVRDGLLAAGRIVNLVKGELLNKVPERSKSALYLANDPTIQHLRRRPGAGEAQIAPELGAGGETATAPCAPPLEGRTGVGADSHPVEATENGVPLTLDGAP